MNISGAISRKVTGKYPESIRFISKPERDFAESKNLIKPCENSLLQKRKTACENPYKTCR